MSAPQINQLPLLKRILRNEAAYFAIMAVASYVVARGFFMVFGGVYRFEWFMLRLLPMAFGLAAIYSLVTRLQPADRPGRSQFQPIIFLQILLSACVPLFIHFKDPMLWMDDAGFIMRYFDNLGQGCFYCYNVQDGPVFGVSSFLFGLVGSLLYKLGVHDSETILTILTYGGLFFSSYLLFRIISKVISHPSLTFLAWLAVLTLSRYFWIVANSGMETPFHLAIVLAAFHFFLAKKSRGMWFFLALSVISKLDAVPIAVVIGLFWLIGNGRKLFPLRLRNKELQDLILFAVVPLGLYVLLTLALFGSPLPQSAYAKVYYHAHQDGHWFPFLQQYLANPFIKVLWIAFLITFALHHLVALMYKEREILVSMVFGAAFLASLVLFYFYNPGERMAWYYVVPQILMMLQLVVSLVFLVENFIPAWSFWVNSLLFGTAFLLFWTHQVYEVRWFRQYEHHVEDERYRLGKYIADKVAPTDTLLAGHGLLAAWAKGYVVDMTGLNSKLALKYGANHRVIFDSLRPQWVVNHSQKQFWEDANRFGYAEDTAMYDVNIDGYPTWRLWKRMDTPPAFVPIPVPREVIMADSRIKRQDEFESVDRYVGKGLGWALQDSLTQKVQFAIIKVPEPLPLKYRWWRGDSVVEELDLVIPPIGDNSHIGYTYPFYLNVPAGGATKFEFLGRDNYGFVMVEPVAWVPRSGE